MDRSDERRRRRRRHHDSVSGSDSDRSDRKNERCQLHPDRSARWCVTIRIRIRTADAALARVVGGHESDPDNGSLGRDDSSDSDRSEGERASNKAKKMSSGQESGLQTSGTSPRPRRNFKGEKRKGWRNSTREGTRRERRRTATPAEEARCFLDEGGGGRTQNRGGGGRTKI
ncbi:hypothetical protein ACHAWF_015362 [Thalassiosira exigua]